MSAAKSRFITLVSFCFVGTIGFLMDTLVLYMLRNTLGLYYGRLISFSISVLCTWILNKKITFKTKQSGLSAKRELFFYGLLMLIGGAVNYSVFVVMTKFSIYVYQNPIIGVGLGSIAGMLVNLTSTRFFLFNKVI